MRRLVLAVALVLVLAGCGSPSTTNSTTGGTETTPTAAPSPATAVSPATATPSPTRSAPTATVEPPVTSPLPTTPATPNPSNPSEIAVEGGSLPVDPNRVFARVQSLLGTDVAPPQSVVVRRDSGIFSTDVGQSVPPFWSLLGVTPSAPTEPVPITENGYTTALGRIVLYPGEQSNATSVSWLLAHEFVHYIHFSQGRASDLRRTLGGASTDNQFVYRAVLEGAAVYTTDAYIEQYAPTSEPNSELYIEISAAFPPGSYQRYANAQYVEGAEYVRNRVDALAATEEVYVSPPQTSEQVIHGLLPTTEPARPLAVTLQASESAFVPAGRNTMGEAFVRTVLANGVSESRAAVAATGWGADRLVIARTPNGDAGYAWVLRWDDATNASEFVAAFREYQEIHRMEDDSELRLTSVNDETVVVLAGDPGFVDAAVVNGTNSVVTVTIESTGFSSPRRSSRGQLRFLETDGLKSNGALQRV